MHVTKYGKPKVVIFDLDGTLIDSIADITDCANSVLTNHGFPALPVDRFRELVGHGFANLVRKVLPSSELTPERLDHFIAEYRALYRERWNQRTTVYAGIHDLLAELERREYTLAVLSNKRDDFTAMCVAHFFPTVRFAEVRGERPGTPIKPSPDAALEIARSCGVTAAECVFVGDSEVDIETAKCAQMVAVGVLWGFRSRATIEAAGADIVIAHPAELVGLL